MNELSADQIEALSLAITKLTDTLNPAEQGLMNFSKSASGAASSLSGVNLNPLVAGSKQAAIEAANSAKSIKLLGQAAGQYSDAFLSAKTGTGKYAASVSSAGDAIQQFGRTLGPVGMAATYVAGALFKLAASSLKQNEALINSYNTLSNFGAINEQGVEGVKNLAHQFGTTSENLQFVQKVIADTAPILTSFGGSVMGGTKRLAELNNDIKNDHQGTELALRRMGISAEQMTVYSGQFATIVSKNGTSQSRTTGELKNSFVDLMKVTTELADITGVSRDAQMKQMEENQRDVRWRAHLAGLSKDQQDRENLALVAYQSMNKGMGELYKDLKATGGGVTSQYTAMQQRMFGRIDLISDKELASTEDSALAMAKAMKASGAQLNSILAPYMGQKFTLPGEALEAMGISADTFTARTQISNMSMEDLTEKIKKLGKVSSDRIDLDTTREKSERDSQIMADDLTFTVGNLAVPAITGMAWITNRANEAMAGFVKLITRGKVDYTDQFKTINNLDEANQSLNKAKDEELKLLKEKAELDKEIQENEERILEARSRGDIFSTLHALLKDRDTLREKKAGVTNQQSANNSLIKKASGAQAKFGASETKTFDDVLKFTDKSGAKENFLALDGALRDRVVSAATQYKQATGNKLTVNSAYRSLEDQQRLWNESEAAGTPGTLKGRPVAQPGTSNHGQGLAVDINEQDANAIAALKAAGLRNTVKNDPIHWGAASGGVFNGPRSGYSVELHGHEAVVPMSTFNNFFKNSGQDNSGSVSKTALHTSMPTITNPKSGPDMTRFFEDFSQIMGEKLDELIHEQRQSKYIQEQLLTAAKH